MKPKDRRFKRGAYLLPTLFTVGNLFCGYSAVVASFRGRFEMAAFLILSAAVLDALDGRVARMTGSTSEFGRELDSLADAVSFGVAPSVMIFAWGLEPLVRFGWLASFLFVACGIIRLARFNIRSGKPDKRYFIGLPVPVAGLLLAACVLVSPSGPEAHWMQACVLALVVILSLLMVSRLRYRSFKDLNLRGRVPSFVVVGVVLGFVAVASHPPLVVLVLGLLYVLSGLIPRAWLQRQDERRSDAMFTESAEADDGKRSF